MRAATQGGPYNTFFSGAVGAALRGRPPAVQKIAVILIEAKDPVWLRLAFCSRDSSLTPCRNCRLRACITTGPQSGAAAEIAGRLSLATTARSPGRTVDCPPRSRKRLFSPGPGCPPGRCKWRAPYRKPAGSCRHNRPPPRPGCTPSGPTAPPRMCR